MASLMSVHTTDIASMDDFDEEDLSKGNYF